MYFVRGIVRPLTRTVELVRVSVFMQRLELLELFGASHHLKFRISTFAFLGFQSENQCSLRTCVSVGTDDAKPLTEADPRWSVFESHVTRLT